MPSDHMADHLDDHPVDHLDTAETVARARERDVQRRLVFPLSSAALLTAGMIVLGLGASVVVSGGAIDKLITAMLINAIMVVGIQIYIGNTGVFSFGHVGFGAIAAYTFALLAIDPVTKASRIPEAPFGLADVQLPIPVAMLVAVIVTLGVAVIVGIGLARSGAGSGAVAATVITLALLFVVEQIAANTPDISGGDRSGLTFGIGETLSSRWPVYIALLFAVAAATVFQRSRAGRLAIAGREDELAARAMGINPAVQQTIALLLSVTVVAVAACLRVYNIGSLLPDTFFLDYTLTTLVMLIVGGRKGVTGALTGVVIVTFFDEAARRLGSSGYEFFGLGLDSNPVDILFREGLPTVVLGLLMVVFMIVRPAGVLDDWDLDNWLRKRFGRSTSDELPAEAVPIDPPAPARLATDNIVVQFGGFRALDAATIEARNDEIVGLIGPNGAGKTTLVNVITGLVIPLSGSVRLDDRDLTGAEPYQIARAGLVRTFQNLRLFGSLTVRENVEVSALVAQRHRQGRSPVAVDTLIDNAGLWEHRHVRARNLDYGNSRRLELARAAAMLPDFLLLDEPTSGMSDAESLDMIDHVRTMAAAVGAGVVVIDHDLAFITGICDRIYCLDQGAVIADGTPAHIQADPAVRAAYLGTSAPT